MKEIRTGRLILRPFRESDYDDLFEFLSQLEDDEFVGYPGITYENGREHLKYRVGSEEFYAMALADSGKVIGNIYCGNQDFEAREVGYIVNRRYQRQGYAAEALSAVIDRAFREGAHRVFAECDPRNVPSWTLLEKVGMRREAHLRQNIWFHRDENGAPIWKDTYVYTRLSSDAQREPKDTAVERQYTRIDEARALIDPIIKGIADEEAKRCAYVHLYGTGLTAALLALRRGGFRETAELAEIAGMLHDLLKYVNPAEDTIDHAHRCADFAKARVLDRMPGLTDAERELIYSGIRSHSDKRVAGTDFDEIIKDADELHHVLRNPAEDYFFQKERAQRLLNELTDGCRRGAEP